VTASAHRLAAHPRDLVTMRAAAGQLGVSVRTLQRWIAAGQLDAYQVGPTSRIR